MSGGKDINETGNNLSKTNEYFFGSFKLYKYNNYYETFFFSFKQVNRKLIFQSAVPNEN